MLSYLLKRETVNKLILPNKGKIGITKQKRTEEKGKISQSLKTKNILFLYLYKLLIGMRGSKKDHLFGEWKGHQRKQFPLLIDVLKNLENLSAKLSLNDVGH